MKVNLPPPLFSYTGGVATVEVEATGLPGMLAAIEARYPGIRFRIVDEQDRIRPHIRFFVNGRPVTGLDAPAGPASEVHVIAALSGG